MDSERCNALKNHQKELQFSTTESFHVLAKFPFCEETVTNNYSWDNRKMFDHLLLSDFLQFIDFTLHNILNCNIFFQTQKTYSYVFDT